MKSNQDPVAPWGYTIKQLADGGPVSRATLYREIADGELEVINVRGRTIVTPQAWDGYLARKSGRKAAA